MFFIPATDTSEHVADQPQTSGGPFLWLMRIVLFVCWVEMIELFFSLGTTLKQMFF